MAGMGLYYLRKEKDDRDSVKIYRSMTMIGVVLAVGSIAVRTLL